MHFFWQPIIATLGVDASYIHIEFRIYTTVTDMFIKRPEKTNGRKRCPCSFVGKYLRQELVVHNDVIQLQAE